MSELQETANLKQTNGLKYGSLGTPKRVVYCVHGKPNAGCCTVLEKEVQESFGVHSGPDLSQARENSHAANLINKHCHSPRSEETDGNARKKLILASILCLIFMAGEILGGYLSSSLAIATDAAHLLTDFASFMISLFAIWVATRPPTRKMSFGWYRAEVIGALTSVLMIWVVTGVLIYLATERILHEDYEIESEIMLITSGVGVAVNIVMGLTLHQHGHTHHGSNHKGEHTKSNINVKAAFIHVVGDFLQSVGVFIAAIVIYFKPDYKIVDPICTYLFSILVVMTTFTILKETTMVLMEGIPKGIDFTDVMNIFLDIEGVKKVHNLRIWALSLDKTAMSAHVAILPGINPQLVLMQATKNIHDKYNFFEITLQIEEFQESMEDCCQCKTPPV